MGFRSKILSVDDSSTMRKIVGSVVKALNYDFLEASDGNEALDVLTREYESVKMILLDWNMPGMNGIDFLQAVKKNNVFRSIPVIMVTTQGEKNSIVKAVQAGAVNYILKPFTPEDLIKKIMQCVKRE